MLRTDSYIDTEVHEDWIVFEKNSIDNKHEYKHQDQL